MSVANKLKMQSKHNSYNNGQEIIPEKSLKIRNFFVLV